MITREGSWYINSTTTHVDEIKETPRKAVDHLLGAYHKDQSSSIKIAPSVESSRTIVSLDKILARFV